jgi:imidazolonepropionase-like amidohydrolase
MSREEALRSYTWNNAYAAFEEKVKGSLEAGKLADIALWRLDTLAHAGIADPVAGLVLADRPPLELLLVGGQVVVEKDRLTTADENSLKEDAVAAGNRLLRRADPRFT